MIKIRVILLVVLPFFFAECSFILNREIKETSTSPFHLILNSTGFATEFCIFEIESENLECKAKKVKSYSKCTEYFSENTNTAALSSKETLDQIYKGLAELELFRPSLKKKITKVGYITTGSLNQGKDTSVLRDVENYFRSENLKIQAKPVLSEEEAKLTMKAIQSSEEIPKSEKEIVLLQIGSESVDITFSSLKQLSSKIGIQLILEEVANMKPGINTCRQPISSFFKSESSSFDRCKSFILENLKKSQRLSLLTKTKLDDGYKVFTTGSTWNYYYPNKEEVSVDELNQTGNEFCSLTIDEIMKKGIKKRHAYNLCYSLSYKAVLAEALGIQRLQILQKDVLAKNLAGSSILFPDTCR